MTAEERRKNGFTNEKLRKDSLSFDKKRFDTGLVAVVHAIEAPVDRFNIYHVVDANEVRDPMLFPVSCLIFLCAMFVH